MTADEYLVRVDGGEYLIMGDEADIAAAVRDADLPEDYPVVAGPGVAFVRILGNEDTEFVSVGYTYFETAPLDRLQSLYAGWTTVDHCRIRTDSPLEIRSVEQEPITTITPGPGLHAVAVCRKAGVGGDPERHHILVWPQPLGTSRLGAPTRD